uniref:Collagenase NC10/endostatin domain-containing protein n=1 Tax=Latimeria chalumnae TaxID=7897 RepID=H3AP77_LATCH
ILKTISLPTVFAQLKLVALNVPLSGNMHGVRGADLQCHRQAREVGLLGTFRSFLSTAIQDLAALVKRTDRAALPIVNLKGQMLFQNWNSLFRHKGARFNSRVPLYSFNGRNVMTDPLWQKKVVWHGSTSKGSRALDNDCRTWHQADGVTGMASRLDEGKLLEQRPHNCTETLIILCIENAYLYTHMWR